MKTTEQFATSSEVAIASAVDAPFTLYIGDNLAGVSTPLKSLAFVASGNYTGGGTLALSLDSDAATSQTFTLPAVSVPTPFEILYNDPSDKVNPVSAGSYGYTLNVVPSGVTLYGFSAALSETHRYVPPSCPDGAAANEKMKTNEFFVTSADVAVSAATSTTFSFYVGDDIAGVANAVKSAVFVVTGIYTGGGSVSFALDGNTNSTETFTLPSVSAPTAFEILFKDKVSLISPTSPGVYQYTIATTPSGVVFPALGITLRETHRYKPPACGGFPVKGELYSAVFDATGTSTGPSYNAVLWKGVLGGPGENQGKVHFQIAASDCANGASNAPTCSVGSWTFLGGATCAANDWFDSGAPDTTVDIQANCAAQFANKRYFRYLAEICSDDCIAAGNYSPRVDDVVINYSP